MTPPRGPMRPLSVILMSLAAVGTSAAQADDRSECREGIALLRTQMLDQRSSKERQSLQARLRKAEVHLAKRQHEECSAAVRSASTEDKAQEEEGPGTGSLFGFTEEADVMDKGKLKLSSEVSGSFGRREGQYRVSTFQNTFTIAPVEGLNIEVGAFSNHFLIRNVPDIDDRHAAAFGGFLAELKWQLVKRGTTAPFGLALVSEPSVFFQDQSTGEPGRGVSIETRLAVDTALVPDTVFAALNLIYEAEEFDPRGGAPERGSDAGVSGALAYHVTSKVAFGGEARYLRSYDGLALQRFQGHALFLGPTFKAKLTEQLSLSGTWSIQVAGRSVENPGYALDLDNFSRHEAKLKISYEF